MSEKKMRIENINDLKIVDIETGNVINPNFTRKYSDPENSTIKGSLFYSSNTINELKNNFNYGKVSMEGFYNDLNRLKSELEKFYDMNVFTIGMTLDDAPYHGWTGEDLKEMQEISREIKKRMYEIYAILLCGLGE